MKNKSATGRTIIHSNGSKYMGQKPDSIAKLVSVLKAHPISKDFFFKRHKIYEDRIEKYSLCPITKENGVYRFFGNFDGVSHVFNIQTTEPKLISTLKGAIMNNSGWKKHINNLKTAQS